MALMVIRHTNDGMTVVATCKVVGLPRSTFYDICKQNPERIAKFNKMIELSHRLNRCFPIHAHSREFSYTFSPFAQPLALR